MYLLIALPLIHIIPLGIYPAFPGNVTWISNNLAGGYKRAAGMAIHIGLGNLAGGWSSKALAYSESFMLTCLFEPWPQISTDRRTALNTYWVMPWS